MIGKQDVSKLLAHRLRDACLNLYAEEDCFGFVEVAHLRFSRSRYTGSTGSPSLGADGRSLFFTSERPGLVKEGEVEGRPPGDLYFVRLPDRNR